MKTEVQNEQETIREAISVLLERMPPSKVARVLAFWRVGRGDYLAIKDKLFEGETEIVLMGKF
jgi:hypothetical protein